MDESLAQFLLGLALNYSSQLIIKLCRISHNQMRSRTKGLVINLTENVEERQWQIQHCVNNRKQVKFSSKFLCSNKLCLKKTVLLALSQNKQCLFSRCNTYYDISSLFLVITYSHLSVNFQECAYCSC